MFVHDSYKVELGVTDVPGTVQSNATIRPKQERESAKIAQSTVPCDLETGSDAPSNAKVSTTSYSESRSPLRENERKVELRMDEITSKFKNAFERMAELESLQLSMEHDSEEGLKEKWFLERTEASGIKKTSFQEKASVGRSMESASGSAGGALIRAKEERLSPGPDEATPKTANLDIEGNYDRTLHDNRHDIADDRGFPPEWSYEEQFKKLYDLGDELERKEFLDKLFAFMQHRGTPVNRVPIMAKQTLDLFKLFKLVTDRGGLVEVINKKIWRGIIKGLNLPSSVTSAAFTLRTQYMKYLYPYECSTLKLSSPTELQCAIDGNRRDTSRRPSIGHYTSMVEPEVGFYSNSTSPKSNCSSPTLKRPSSPPISQLRLPAESEFVTPSFHGNNGIGFTPAIQRIITSTSDTRPPFKYDARSHSPAYTNGRVSYEPPYKRIASSEELEKHMAMTQNPWANIKIRTTGGRGIPIIHENGEDKDHSDEHTNNAVGKSPKRFPSSSFEQGSDNSIVVSIELNGVKYEGVLYAQHR